MVAVMLGTPLLKRHNPSFSSWVFQAHQRESRAVVDYGLCCLNPTCTLSHTKAAEPASFWHGKGTMPQTTSALEVPSGWNEGNGCFLAPLLCCTTSESQIFLALVRFSSTAQSTPALTSTAQSVLNPQLS